MRRAALHCAILILVTSRSGAGQKSEDANRIYQQRVIPILRSDSASSCRECHFAGIELRDYLREDPVATFAALRSEGLIDTEHPEKSRILTFISRSPEKPDPLIMKVRNAEYAAMKTWIEAASRNPQLRVLPGKVRVGTELDLELIRHARQDRVVSSFVDNIWSEMARCVNCHSSEKNGHQIARLGKAKVEAISWIVPGDPAATLARLDRDGLIDTHKPADSAVLLKPAGLVEHGGGPKFVAGGPEYRKFESFLTDYSAIRNGLYRKAGDLPAESPELILLTAQHLRITQIPASVGKGPLRVDLFEWQADTQAWSPARVAVAMNVVNAEQHVFQSMVSVTVARSSHQAAALRKTPILPSGKYIARVFQVLGNFDPGSNAAADSQVSDSGSKEQLLAEIPVEGAWPDGYQPPKMVAFPRSGSDSR